MNITINYTLPPDAAPEDSVLRGWEPSFAITGRIYSYHQASATAPAEGGECEITNAICTECLVLPGHGFRLESALNHLLETDMALRHRIEDLLVEAARDRYEAQRMSA